MTRLSTALVVGLVLAVASGLAGWVVRGWRCDAKIQGIKSAAAEATSSALRREQARAEVAILEANAAQDRLSRLTTDLQTARDARTAAERRLFDALDQNPDLDGPGIPDGVLRSIQDQWRSR